MFSALRNPAASRTLLRAFSSTPSRARDMAKLTLIGNLAKDPEARMTKNDKEFIVYTVVTQGPSLPPDANGDRQSGPSTFHRVISFSETANKYLRGLRKGAKVYAEASFELREPEAGADPNTPQGQRQIFLRHETVRVLSLPKSSTSSSLEASETAETTL